MFECDYKLPNGRQLQYLHADKTFLISSRSRDDSLSGIFLPEVLSLCIKRADSSDKSFNSYCCSQWRGGKLIVDL